MKAEDNRFDPLLHFFTFPLEATFYPYGFPLLVRTNDPRVLTAAAIAFGAFPKLADHPPLRLDIAITGNGDGPFPSTPVIRSQDHLLWFISDTAHFATCDFQSGVGVAWLTPSVFSNDAHFRFHFLEAMGFSLVAERYLAAIHAACLTRNNCGMLFWGEAGAGKSSLSYALAKSGWTYTADDGSFLLIDSDDNTITGNPTRIRFRPSAVELFPELDGLLPIDRPIGKPTIEVSTTALNIPSTSHLTQVQHVVFLNRQTGAAPQLRPFPKEEALARLTSSNHFGRASTESAKRQALHRVLSGGIWEFTYSDLQPAIKSLESLAIA